MEFSHHHHHPHHPHQPFQPQGQPSFDIQKSFHGDPERDHSFWLYPAHSNLENFMLWDFIDPPQHICTNH